MGLQAQAVPEPQRGSVKAADQRKGGEDGRKSGEESQEGGENTDWGFHASRQTGMTSLHVAYSLVKFAIPLVATLIFSLGFYRHEQLRTVCPHRVFMEGVCVCVHAVTRRVHVTERV